MEELDFGDPAPAVFPLKIGGKRYVIREITHADRVKRDAHLAAHTVRDADGRFVRFDDDVGDVAGMMISMCLFENAGSNGDVALGQPVPGDVINGWSDAIREKLSNKILDMCPSLQADTEEEIDRQIEMLEKRKAAIQAGKAPTAKN